MPQSSSICRLRSVANCSPSSARSRSADLLASRVEDGQLLLGEVVVDDAGELLDGVVERLGVGALELQHGQQRLVALGVLLLAVLGLVLADRALAPQLRVDVLLLGLGVRDVQGCEGAAHGVAVGAAVAQVAQEGLEAAVVVEDQLDDVALDRSAEVDGGLSMPPRYPLRLAAMTSPSARRVRRALVVGVTAVLSVALRCCTCRPRCCSPSLVGGMAHALTSPTPLELPPGPSGSPREPSAWSSGRS